MSADIAVVGAGSWGTALAMQLARVGHRVRLWARDAGHVAEMRDDRINRRYLPDAPLADSIAPHSDLEAALDGADRVLIAVPSSAFAAALDAVAPLLDAGCGLAWATKGFEPGTGRLLSETARDRLGPRVPLAVVTGPSFAGEVARGLPTAVTVGASEPGFGRAWARLLHGSSFRAYYTADVVGAQLGGAIKNVLAIACGMADGLGLGQNTRAALITRGLAEMMRLGQGMDAQARTLTGLAGLGAVGVTVGLLTGPLQNPLPPESRALLAQYRALEQRPGLRVIGGSALELTPAGSHGRVYLVATTANPDSDSDG